MFHKNFLSPFQNSSRVSWFDVIVIFLFFCGGYLYLSDIHKWSLGYIGETPYGDAQFWWSGALHFAQGLFIDNPGKGFRPGYFIIAGFAIPVLGTDFHQFYLFFLAAFFAAASFFYLALRNYIGYLAAFCTVCVIIFNPYTAEWLATSTTDATGLTLHLTALSCLLYGLHNGMHKKWLFAFGFFFAFATLTRPLMTPFIGLVAVGILFLRHISFKNRLKYSLIVVAAFALPLLTWMTIQKIVINQWAISTNEAGALYAPSDPEIQAWHPSMYDPIKELAKKKYGPNITDKELNIVFKEETLKNYKKHWRYHLERFFPHYLEIAKFSPSQATHGSDSLQIYFYILLCLGFAVVSIANKQLLKTFIFLALAISIYKYNFLIFGLMLVGIFTGWLITAKSTNRLAMVLISAYWLTGAFALYVVGGTFGPPLAEVLRLNALGYRLGGQVFFLNDFFAIISLALISRLKTRQTFTHFLFVPSRTASNIIVGTFFVFISLTIFVYITGITQVAYRNYSKNKLDPIKYPNLTPIINEYAKKTKHNLIFAKNVSGSIDLTLLTTLAKHSQDLIFTGTISPFIWNLQGQPRAQLMAHSQSQVLPYTMGPSYILLEIPKHLTAKTWAGVQGAFIIRSIPNKHNNMYSPYQFSSPSVRAFIPLTKDKKTFALNEIIYFPLIKNITQLDTEGNIHIRNADIKWSSDSGVYKFQRRVNLIPKKANQEIQLSIDTANAIGSSKLSFSPTISDEKNSKATCKVKIFAISKVDSKKHLVKEVEATESAKNVEIDIPVNTKGVEILFSQLGKDRDIWLYEFNLSAKDFARGTGDI